jgi:hypothetical protein
VEATLTFTEAITATWTEQYQQDGVTKTATYASFADVEFNKLEKKRVCRARMQTREVFTDFGALTVAIPVGTFLSVFPQEIGEIMRRLEPTAEELRTDEPPRSASCIRQM